MRLPQVSPPTYRRIALVALASQVLIIVTGAAVRLTASGLGCSDWPSCEEDRFVAPLEGHALIEFANRTLSGVVLLAVGAAILGALWRVPYRRDLLGWSSAQLLGVVGQIIIGGVVVRLELAPVSVVGHFLVSIALVWAATVLYERSGHPDTPGVARVPALAVTLGRLMVLAALVVVVTGTLVTATGPHGGDDRADRLGWFDIAEIARIHGGAGLVLLALTLVALVVVHRHGAAGARRRGAELAVVLTAQIAIGYTQYFNGIPPLLVGLHVLVATLVWIAVVRFHLGLFTHPEVLPAPSPAGSDPTGAHAGPVPAAG